MDSSTFRIMNIVTYTIQKVISSQNIKGKSANMHISERRNASEKSPSIEAKKLV